MSLIIMNNPFKKCTLNDSRYVDYCQLDRKKKS